MCVVGTYWFQMKNVLDYDLYQKKKKKQKCLKDTAKPADTIGCFYGKKLKFISTKYKNNIQINQRQKCENFKYLEHGGN